MFSDHSRGTGSADRTKGMRGVCRTGLVKWGERERGREKEGEKLYIHTQKEREEWRTESLMESLTHFKGRGRRVGGYR